MKLSDCVVFVTGGASGLGAGCAKHFAQKGAKVVIADLNEEAGQGLAQELNALFIPTDVTQEPSVSEALNQTLDNYNNLHVVINCAGVAPPQKTVRRENKPHDLALFNQVIQVNLVGTFNVIRLAATHMIERNQGLDEAGVIINTASVAAFEGQIGQAAYSASKGGVVGMTLPIARDLASHKIRVVTIAPGIFNTPMMAGLSEKVKRSLLTQVPFPSRLGEPSEYAALASHIVENPMLNAATIRLDGALRMGMM